MSQSELSLTPSHRHFRATSYILLGKKRNTRKALYGRVLLIWSPPFLFIRSTKKSLLEGKLRSFK